MSSIHTKRDSTSTPLDLRVKKRQNNECNYTAQYTGTYMHQDALCDQMSQRIEIAICFQLRHSRTSAASYPKAPAILSGSNCTLKDGKTRQESLPADNTFRRDS